MARTNTSKRSATSTLARALALLAHEIESTDGVANAAIQEGAERLEELRELLKQCLPHVEASAGAQHMLDGLRKQKPTLPIDKLVQEIEQATK